MTRKRFYIGLGIFLFIFVALVIVVSVNNGALDYALSKTLVTTLEPGTRYATTMFGRLGEMLGESPLYLLIQFSFIVFAIVTSKRKNKPLFIVLEIVFLLVSACAGLACVHRIEKYICLYYSPESEWKELFAILPLIVNFVIGSGITLLVFFLLKKPLSKVNEKNLLSYFIMGLIACGVALILVNYVFKPIFNRVRYRGLNMNDSLVFSPWYFINKVPSELGVNIKDDFTSFPSGHSASAATCYLIMFLPFYFDTLRTKKGYILCTLIPFVISTTIAVSRIFMGAHYLSDVLFGTVIVFVLLWVSYFIERKITKHSPFISSRDGKLTIY